MVKALGASASADVGPDHHVAGPYLIRFRARGGWFGSGIVHCPVIAETPKRDIAQSVSGIMALAAMSPGQRRAAAMAAAAMMPKSASLIQFMPAISSRTGQIGC